MQEHGTLMSGGAEIHHTPHTKHQGAHIHEHTHTPFSVARTAAVSEQLREANSAASCCHIRLAQLRDQLSLRGHIATRHYEWRCFSPQHSREQLHRSIRQTALLGRSQLQATLHYTADVLSRPRTFAPPPITISRSSAIECKYKYKYQIYV